MNVGFLIDHGGPLIWPLLALSVAAVAAGIERALFFATGGARITGPEPRPQLESWGRTEPDKKARRSLSQSAGGRVLLVANAMRRGATGWTSLDRQIRIEFGRLTRKLRGLDAIITAAPMVGILGTVVGLVNGFIVRAGADDGVSRETLTAGVAQALATTVLGLCIAVGALIIRHMIGSRADRARQQLLDYVRRVEVALDGEGR